jgi:hypothetical protein
MALFFDRLTFEYGATSHLDKYLLSHPIILQKTGNGIFGTLNNALLKTITLPYRTGKAIVGGFKNGDGFWKSLDQGLKVEAKFYKSTVDFAMGAIKDAQSVVDHIINAEEKGFEALLNVITFGHSKWFNKGIKDVNKVVKDMQKVADNVVKAVLDIPLKLAEDAVHLETQLYHAAFNHSISGILNGITRDSKGFRHSMTRVGKFVNNLVTDPSKINALPRVAVN